MNNDLLEIKDILLSFIEYSEKQFENIKTRFNEIDRCFEDIDKRFEAIDNRFEAIDKRLEDIDKRLENNDRLHAQTQILLAYQQQEIEKIYSSKASKPSIETLEHRIEVVEKELKKLKKPVLRK